MIINVSVDLNDFMDEDETFADIIREEIRHEFKLAVRRAIKENNNVEQQAKKLARQLGDALESEMLAFLSSGSSA